MPIYSRRLLDQATVNDGDTLDLSDAPDLGEYHTLGLAVTVHEAGVGTAPLLVVEHAASNATDYYGAFSTPAQVALDVTGTTFVQVDAFLRWVRWTTSGSLSSPATVTLDLIAKA